MKYCVPDHDPEGGENSLESTVYDAIIVPGGGVREGGALPTWVQRRLQRALDRHRHQFIIALSAGTTHRAPPMNEKGFPIFESVAAARYLMSAGVSPRCILLETCSYDTIGNAFFARVIHTDPQQLANLLVITSDFHARRTQAIFEWVFALDPRSVPYHLDFEAVSDPEMQPEVLQERDAKEACSLHETLPLIESIRTMKEFHRWLFQEHDAYGANGRAFAGQRAQGALESY